MKSLLLLAALLFGVSAIAQTTNTTPPAAKVSAPAAANAPAAPVAPKPVKAKKAAAKKAPAAPAASETPAAPATTTSTDIATPATTTPALGTATPSATTDASAPTLDPSLETAEEVVPKIDLKLNSGIMTNLGLTYYSRDLSEESTIDSKFNSLNAEFRAGYIFDFGLFAGLTGHYDTGKANNNTVATMYAGPTVGYTCNYTGLFAAATYYVFGNSDLDAAGEYDKVNGFQIDVAYPMSINESLKFGPQLSYRSMKASESDTLADSKTKELVPFMGLWYIF